MGSLVEMDYHKFQGGPGRTKARRESVRVSSDDVS